ncbi:MAG: LysM peptidoglycan-binding domain-containing protein [Spirochaetaceae bacterium]|nr:LysM peptidoglycan-binding domain-containing protein [Spirochaetaceae bacterium]
MKFKLFLPLFFLGLCFLGAHELHADELQTADSPAAENSPPDDTALQTATTGVFALDGDGGEEPHVPDSLKNNRYYLDSLRYTNLARLSFGEGEYDQSAEYSEEAARLARLSDEYISEKLKYARGVSKLYEAQKRLEWAEESGAAKYYPKEVGLAKDDYAQAVDARKAEDWANVIVWAEKVIADLEGVAAPPPAGAAKNQPELPTQYRVRPWDEFGDCLWNISKWFYGSPWHWRRLYEVNKHKLPDPDNPNLLEIGTVIDIPSLAGEQRVGLYDTGTSYSPSSGTL